MSAKTYIKNVVARIEGLLGITLKNYGSPMVTGYHSEIDESEQLDQEHIKIYQTMIGCAQWAVTLGRYDIQYATNTLARYTTYPKQGHLKSLIRLFGYLKHHRKYKITFSSKAPNYEDFEFLTYDWTYHYRDACDEIPPDMPKSITKEAHVTVYVDASHACDLVTRRSVTGILIFINTTPVKWYSKRQNTVETSTYGSELVAVRIAIELALDYRYKLGILGFQVTQPATVL